MAETLVRLVRPGAADGWENAVLSEDRSPAVPPASWNGCPSTR
ncbi:hypothetical protein [Streptomyces litchfieldiae]|uniref:Uncharacterized protein n=1 Tax=Streptomyces litchfieldiae TaxID=3075543 RepID=A0ABU2MR64_9ACTN|nr:hypothetical protein [Streptomyces sp. DSM 44938]MDT0344121.1 hypothetical protein [Streptomyces sp. DSM 44938]